MDFDWIGAAFDLSLLPPKDIEESFEDPFSIKLLPDGLDGSAEARYYNLGKSLQGKSVFSVFWTDGKHYRVIFARLMTSGEHDFFERKKAEEI
ncbi:MAG: BrnT family toxin [Verrucomicrobia bacterium]|nr:BrnT family toxin [Verrucomicrobiota bacterium]